MSIQRIAPSEDKLQLVLIEELKNVKAAPMENALTKGIEETSAKAFKIGFRSANTGIKSAFSCFLVMVW